MANGDTQAATREIIAPIPVFHRERIVESRDLDALDHVNNAAWVRFVSELAEAHSAAVGLDFQRYVDLNAFWVVSRHEIDYFLPALPGERIIEQTWLSELKGALAVRHSRFSRAGDRALLLKATSRWAFVDGESQRPRRIHPEVLERFTASEGPEGA